MKGIRQNHPRGRVRGKVHSEPILELHLCKECGCSNAALIGGGLPEKCSSCGTVFDRELVNRKAFMGKFVRPGKEDCLVETATVLGMKSHRWKKQRDMDLKKLEQDLLPAKETLLPGYKDEDCKRRRRHKG